MNRSLVLFAVGSISTNGGSVVVSNDFVTYTPATNFVGSDRFSYTIDDGWGGFSAANVVVSVLSGSAQSLNMLQPCFTPTGVLVRFAGIPGRQYSIQRAPTATGPWETIGVAAVATDGLGGFTDPNPPGSSAFYRTCYP